MCGAVAVTRVIYVQEISGRNQDRNTGQPETLSWVSSLISGDCWGLLSDCTKRHFFLVHHTQSSSNLNST